MDNLNPASKGRIIKSIYFYLVCFVALMMVVFSFADAINIALKTWVFTAADKDMYYVPSVCTGPQPLPPGIKEDLSRGPVMSVEECEKQNAISAKQQETNRIAQKQNSVVRDISMIVVGIPLFLIHWNILRRKDENL